MARKITTVAAAAADASMFALIVRGTGAQFAKLVESLKSTTLQPIHGGEMVKASGKNGAVGRKLEAPNTPTPIGALHVNASVWAVGSASRAYKAANPPAPAPVPAAADLDAITKAVNNL